MTVGTEHGETAERFGVVAILDALGFKGIWRHYSAEQILRTLSSVRDGVQSLAAADHYLGEPFTVHTHFVSDTIVIAASGPGSSAPSEETLGAFLWLVARSVALTQAIGAQSKPVLAYRGSIAMGRLVAGGQFIVGEAVDEAAQWMEQADAAIVWFTPRAATQYAQCGFQGKAEVAMIMDHAVPMRDGRHLRTLAVNPIGRAERRSEFVETILGSFDDPERTGSQVPVDVIVKKQNTERFLLAALSRCDALLPQEPGETEG